jgi:uncharacterized membrane protein
MERGRVEAFSDGVFAVAITFLVLTLKVPSTSGPGSLVHQLLKQWPGFAAWLISFMVIGIIWVNHHTFMNKLARVDRTMLFLNLLLLLFVVFLPYPTGIVADYLRVGGWDAKVAVALYSAVMLGMSLAFSAMYRWAGRHDELLDESVDVDQHRAAFRQFAVGMPIYAGLIGMSFLSAEVALAGHFALAVFYVFDQTVARAGA